MNENLNLVELLKDVPKGTKFYCTMYGYVKFEKIYDSRHDYPIMFITEHETDESVTIDGREYYNYPDGECVFFPSKEQRDWGLWAKEQEEAKKQLLPIDTPVMVDVNGGESSDYLWILRYYAESNTCFNDGYKSTDEVDASAWDIIIPFDKFNPNDIEESLKHNIVKLI